MLNIMAAPEITTRLFQCEDHSVRTHYLLEIDSNQFLSYQTFMPDWVEESLQQTPFVVVRRGEVTLQQIPIGIRGTQRNQRWATICHPELVRKILTPPQLLFQLPRTRANIKPALRSLQLLTNYWMDLEYPWGPGGSVGFELATHKQVVNQESDLDIVVYAEPRMTVAEATSLWLRTIDLPAVVDIRVETPVCGFALGEFVSQSPGPILLRSPDGFMFGQDPWSIDSDAEWFKS